MLSRLDRYVVGQVLQLTGIVALALVSIYTLVVFVADAREQGGNGVLPVLEYSLLMVPSSVYTLMPIIALLGTLMGIGNLARNGELNAMRAAGVSLLRVGAASLVGGLALAAVSFVLGDWLAPASENLARQVNDPQQNRAALMGQSIWLRDADAVVRIDHLDAEDHIRNVTVFRLGPGNQLVSALTADEGRYAGGKWQLTGVHRTDFAEDHVSAAAQDEFDVEGRIDPKVLRLFILEENSISAHGLLRLIDYMNENHLDSAKYRILLWRRLVEPVTVMVMMLFAVPFVAGQLRDASAGQKLLAGAIVGIVFYVFNKVSVSLGDIYQWPAPLAAGLPTSLLGLTALWRLQRAG